MVLHKIILVKAYTYVKLYFVLIHCPASISVTPRSLAGSFPSLSRPFCFLITRIPLLGFLVLSLFEAGSPPIT